MASKLFLCLALAVLLLPACGDDEPLPLERRVTAVPSAPATATLQPGTYPPGTRTGRRSIDAAIEAVERLDASRLEAALGFIARPCRTQPGYGPPCDPGQADGTMVDFIAYGRCHPQLSQLAFRGAAAAVSGEFIRSQPSGLVAVTYMDHVSPYYGLYGISYASGHVILLDDAGITALLPACPGVGAFPRPLGSNHILSPP